MDSYLKGPTSVTLLNTTIGVFFRELAERYADQPAIVDERLDCRWTYRTLAQRVDLWCGRLASRQLQPGDRIALLCENNADWIAIWLACATSGIVLVSLNLAISQAQIEQRIRDTGARYLLASRHALTVTGLAGHHASSTRESRDTIQVLATDRRRSAARIHTHRGNETPAEMAQSPCMICFSSGTTGAAKPIVLSHGNLLNNAMLVGEALNYQPGQTVCCLFPYLVAGGAVIGVLGVLAKGATIACPPPGANRNALIASLDRLRPDHLMASPRIAEMIFSQPPTPGGFTGHLKSVGMGSTTCLPRFVNRLLDDFAVSSVALIYGMTETSPVTFLHVMSNHVDGDQLSVGRLLPHLEAKIADPTGRTTPTGTVGELWVRGHAVMIGYLDDPDRTAAMIDPDGWLHTGDLAHIDDDGRCFVLGRKSECLHTLAGPVHPHVMERVFLRHRQVDNAQVVALPDGDCCAWVKLTQESRMTRRQMLAYYHTHADDLPPIARVHIVESFPLNETGKIRRNELAERSLRARKRRLASDRLGGRCRPTPTQRSA